MTKDITPDVSAKLSYEWVRTGHWAMHRFICWLETKNIKHDLPLYTGGGTLIHRANGELAYEWIKTKRWNFKQFQFWLNSFL